MAVQFSLIVRVYQHEGDLGADYMKKFYYMGNDIILWENMVLFDNIPAGLFSYKIYFYITCQNKPFLPRWDYFLCRDPTMSLVESRLKGTIFILSYNFIILVKRNYFDSSVHAIIE